MASATKTILSRRLLPGLLIVLIVGLIADSAWADQMELHNGDRWTGRLLRMDRQVVHFEIDTGGIGGPQQIAIARERMATIDVMEPVTARLFSGERLIGVLENVTADTVVVTSEDLGQVTLPWAKVVELRGAETSTASVARLPDASPLAGLPEWNPLGATELAAIRGAGRPSGTGAATDSAAAPAAASTEVGVKMKEEDIRQVFLRQSAVLLQPSQWESEVSFSYTRLQNSTAEAYAENGILSSQRRLFETRLSLRTSPFKRVEVFASVPLLYGTQRLVRSEAQLVTAIDPATGQTTQISTPSNVKHRGDRWGVGDIAVGAKFHLIQEGLNMPDVILSISGVAPTGDDPYDFSPTAVPIGGGHWGLGAGLTAIKTFDPAVVFAGVDYSYRFPGDYLGGTVRPGGILSYNLGTGFALNDKLSLSGQLSGAIQAGSASAPGGIDLRQREQLLLRLAFTYRITQKCYVEPSLSLGLNDDSPDSSVALSISNRF